MRSNKLAVTVEAPETQPSKPSTQPSKPSTPEQVVKPPVTIPSRKPLPRLPIPLPIAVIGILLLFLLGLALKR